jgi:hypothetical protein
MFPIKKGVAFFETFPMIGHKPISKRTCDGCDIQKDLEHMFPLGIWAFPSGKYIALQGRCLSPQKTWAFLQGKSIVPQGSCFFPHEFFFILYASYFLGYLICSRGNFFYSL